MAAVSDGCSLPAMVFIGVSHVFRSCILGQNRRRLEQGKPEIPDDEKGEAYEEKDSTHHFAFTLGQRMVFAS